MTSNSPNSENLLRVINEASAEAEYSDAESRELLREAGVDPDRYSRAAREALRRFRPAAKTLPWDAIRGAALTICATSAAAFVVVFHLDSRATAEAAREAAHAQLISPLLPALTSEDPDRRSEALVIARQIDPAFAAETSARLARWEVSSQAQTRASRNAAYASRMVAGLEKLQLSRDPGDRKVAIWNDLLPVLQEAHKNRDDFVDVAIAYERVLPLLHVKNPEVFLDSYWGELWILNILLDSKIAPVVEAARQQAPDPAVVQQIYQQNAPRLDDRDRKAFEEAVAVYQNAVKDSKVPGA